MSQTQPYPNGIKLRDIESLRKVVIGLVTEDKHAHNFEVWTDELTIRLNDLGLECANRLANGATTPTKGDEI